MTPIDTGEVTYVFGEFLDGISIIFLIVGLGVLFYWAEYMNKKEKEKSNAIK